MQLIGVISKITNNVIKGKLLVYISCSKGFIPMLVKRSKVSKDMPVIVTGDFSGKYFIVEEVKTSFLNPTYYAKYLSAKTKNSGIGLKSIQKITNKYGHDILTMEKEDLRAKLLTDFPSFNVDKIDTFLNKMYERSTIAAIEDFFESYDVPYEVLEKIDEEYGIDAVKKFKLNPYVECSNFDMKIFFADYIAKDQQIEALDPKRIDGFIYDALSKNEKNGNTYIKADVLLKKILGKINRSPAYDTKCYPIYVVNRICTSKLFYIDDQGRVAFKSTLLNEKTVANRLKDLDTLFQSYITVTDDDIKRVEEELGITLGEDQRKALKLLEGHGINILTGGPGVGKTATVNAISRLFLDKVPSGKIKYCAPTGRAAKRLSESVKTEAVTIHKLVEIQPFEKESQAKRCAANPIDADFIIMDEGSMAGISIMAILLTAIKNGTRVLIVGDENQLPSVDCGNFLHDIISSNLFGVYRLEKNYRQDGDGTIVDNSKLVLKGEEPVANDDDFIIEEFENDKEGKARLKEVVKETYDLSDPFKMQVIEPTNAEVYATNKWTHNNVVNHFDDLTNPFVTIGLHDKVMFKTNKYEPDEEGNNMIVYANGEIGEITYIDDDEIVISDGDEEKRLDTDVVTDMTLSYSCTIHKSQGSENPLIVIYLPEKASQMMTRSLLYTAITRARKKVIIVTVGTSLMQCINNIGEQRKTFLFYFLTGANN